MFAISFFSHSPARPHPTFGTPATKQSDSDETAITAPGATAAAATPDLESSGPAAADTEDQTGTPPLEAVDPHRPTTSGIDALKSLLSSSAASRSVIRSPNTRSRFSVGGSSVKPTSSVRPGVGAASIATSSSNADEAGEGQAPVTEPSIEILPSIDPTSDVELVFKTLYTTYTYFTTFFRESTSKVKSREEVISNVITLTNILKSTDIPAVSSSCELDSSCVFHSTDVLSLPTGAGFTDGFIGRPNTGPAEQPRSSGVEDDKNISIISSISPTESLGDLSNGVLRTFFTTYTYFSTLFVDGTSTVSTRTEVYSNIQTADGLLGQQLPSDALLPVTSSSFIANSPSQSPPSLDSSLEDTAVTSSAGRRLETSTLAGAQLQSALTTAEAEMEDSERPSTDRVPRLIPSTEKQAAEESGLFEEAEKSTITAATTATTTADNDGISPTPMIVTSTNPPGVEEEEEGSGTDKLVVVVTQETPALTEEVTEVVTSATTESEEKAEEVAAAAAVTEFVPRTLYTTFTYFTTLFKDGTSTVTSNLETITNVMTDSNMQLTSVEPSVTFFTTFTYWTTSIDGDSTVITSREETITDILPASVTSDLAAKLPIEVTANAQDVAATLEGNDITIEATAAPGLVAEPTVFTFFSTIYDGESSIVETILSTVLATAPAATTSTPPPELESSQVAVEAIISSAPGGSTVTPDISSAIQPTNSFLEIEDDLVLTSGDGAAEEGVEDGNEESSGDHEDEAGDGKSSRSRGRISFSRPSNTFTPVIRPLIGNRKPGRIFRPTNLRVTTTVATRTRNSVKPTLIATPASSAPQPTPTFGSSARGIVLASASLFNRGQSRFSSASASSSSSSSAASVAAAATTTVVASSIAPSTTVPAVARGTATFVASSVEPVTPTSSAVVISPFGLRRPNPFRARLKELQQERLDELRESSSSSSSKPPNTLEGAAPSKVESDVASSSSTNPLPIINLPSIPGANAPIFISAQRQTIPARRPKVEAAAGGGSGVNLDGIEVPEDIAARRERARERIKSLFSKRRPLGTSGSEADNSETTGLSRRRKRQVGSSSSSHGAEFGSRTQARQSLNLNRRSQSSFSSSSSPSFSYSYIQQQPSYFLSQDNPPFTAFRQTQQQSAADSKLYNDYYYEDDVNDDASLYHSSNSKQSRRQAPAEVPDDLSNSARSRSRSRSFSRFSNGSPVQEEATVTTTTTRSRTRFRDFRVRPAETTTEPPRTPAAATRLRSDSRSLTAFSSNNNRNTVNSNGNRVSTSSRTAVVASAVSPAARPNRFNAANTVTAQRNSLFTRPKVVDYSDYDYYDYGDTDIQSSQDGGGRVPDYITVTHQVPIATRIPVVEFGRTEWRDILSTSPSLEVVAVTALKSTDINNSPVIYANAHTITKQPGLKDVLYDALRATETTSISFTPTLIRGRKTSFSHIIPSTIYNVETVSTQIKEPVDNNQLLNSLIQHLLLGGNNPLSANPLAPNPILNQAPAVPQPPQTQFVTHTSTYVTTLTEEKSTVLPITLRGRPITTTIVESSTKVVTATEYSTETIVNTVAAAPLALGGLPAIVATAAVPGLNSQIASLLPALLGANLLGDQQQQQQALIIKQQQEALLKAQQEALLTKHLQEELLRQQQEALNEQLLAKINIEDLSDEELASLDIEDVLEAVTSSSASPKIVFPAKNLFDNAAVTPTAALAATATSTAAADNLPRSSVITIFKSGDRPGEFTSLLSTVFLDSSSTGTASTSTAAKEKRFRRSEAADAIQITRPQIVEATRPPEWAEEAVFDDAEANSIEATLGGARGPVYIQLDEDASDVVLQSGLMSEAETTLPSTSSSVLPTLLSSP